MGNTINDLDAATIALTMSKDVKLVESCIQEFKHRNRQPCQLAELESEATDNEHATYLLPVMKAHIAIDFTTGEMSKSGNPKLLKGQCSCKKPCGRCFNFMVLGKTGTGKTTLIDAYVNFLTGVDFYDKFRYKLIDERAVKADRKVQQARAPGGMAGIQSVSQTSAVTIYHIPAEWITCKTGRFLAGDQKYCINIIDTPGFGDTRGAHIDNHITTMISQTLRGLDSVDNIWFVEKCSENRVSSTTKHVMTRVLNLFANDVADRFFAMLTFSDGKKPMAPDALEDAGLVFDQYCTFNNSAIWESADEKIVRQFWNFGFENFMEFGKKIQQVGGEAVSTSLT